MTADKKLEVILNKGIPAVLGIRLKVDVCPSTAGFAVLILKNGKGLETFYIKLDAAMRLIANIPVEG